MKLFAALFTSALMLVLGNPLISGEPVKDNKFSLTLHSDEANVRDLYQMISPNPFVISAEKVEEITQCCHIQVEELLQLLIPVARTYARPSISNYNVGAVVLGKSGAIYLGANLEFPGVPLNQTVHGEQFAITNARLHGETELRAIAVSAAPCGHCRQFMNEMSGEGELQILIPHCPSVAYASLLPEAFGPKDLGLSGDLLTPSAENHCLHQEFSLVNHALEAGLASYAPYSNARSGVAIQTKDGSIYMGSYLENAAFNPSLAPLQTALVSLITDLRDYSEIKEVVLVEQQSAKISQEVMSREVLKHIAPEASFHVKKLEF